MNDFVLEDIVLGFPYTTKCDGSDKMRDIIYKLAYALIYSNFWKLT